MTQTSLKRKTRLQTHTELRRTEMKRKGPGKAARRRQFSPEIVSIVKERANGRCEWCGVHPDTQTHHCKFRSGLHRWEGSGGLGNALRICEWCDALVHGGTEGTKYRRLFAERAKQLAEGQIIEA